MFKITFNSQYSNADEIIETLQIHDIYNVYYETPFTVTEEKYGYGYEENSNELVSINVICDSKEEADKNYKILQDIIKESSLSIVEMDDSNFQVDFEPIDLNNGYILADPSYDCNDKNKINFIPQGAFGTGIHETTQDLLRFILDMDLSEKSVLDIGTGSGILSIASSIVNANKVTALDIRDVTEEIEFNSSLNSINNIDIVVGNAIEDKSLLSGKIYDLVIINIGGEETELFMPFIKDHIKNNGMLLVSGLVEWSYEEVKTIVESYSFALDSKKQSNEWISLLFHKI
ncbi:50S ribosomal protein L11 methyltransferase [Clostridium hydrogeniformans]|uniref:50S ribosomal protein L11 methyltransferase n=1 Tax=Clostridium hydrogeniformans TaxID=349933 RepID=UPI00047FA38D|nr:50S ribosomal protein L11 methyltransferase [Clostridium hydrogeniformans]